MKLRTKKERGLVEKKERGGNVRAKWKKSNNGRKSRLQKREGTEKTQRMSRRLQRIVQLKSS